MSSKTDFYIAGGLALALAYANLIGPHKLVNYLYPNGEFILKGLASGMLTFSAPEKLADFIAKDRPVTPGKPSVDVIPAKVLATPKAAPLVERAAR